MPKPNAPERSSANEFKQVAAFYESNIVSYEIPGKKDCTQQLLKKIVKRLEFRRKS